MIDMHALPGTLPLAGKKVVVLLSGGIDSTTVAYLARSQGADLICLSFNYGQRHEKEIMFARRTAKRLESLQFEVVDLTSVTKLLPGSSLTDSKVVVPEGHYAEDTMKATVVPNRNAIMLSIAYGVAAAHGAHGVATAVHAGDHYVYPDCRPAFAAAFQNMEVQSLGDQWEIPLLIAPFINKTKAHIVSVGDGLSVPFASTWSCYNGRTKHCGRCGTCTERAAAFHEAGVEDPTEYEDAEYWKTVVFPQNVPVKFD